MEYSLGILLCAIGVVVLVWAFVRPRRGDEPHCRACRFSLAGLTEPLRCPECGRDLSRPRSKVKGHRPSPKRAAFWSLGLVLLGGALIGLDAMNRTGFFPLTKYKPAFVLQAEAYVLGDLRASMATDELVDRINGGTLGKESEDRLVKTALARHAQTWRGFPDAQWIVITMAIDRGELTIAQIERVWNECIYSARLVSSGRSDQIYLPGEEMSLVAGVRTRAGDAIKNNLITDRAFLVSQSIRMSLTTDSGETIELTSPYSTRSFLPRKSRAEGTIPDERQESRFIAPNTVGEYQGNIIYELSYQNISRNWPATEAQLEQLESLKQTFIFPITLRVVRPEDIQVPAIAPKSIRENTKSLIQLELVRAVNNRGGPRVNIRVGVTRALDPSIGLGGKLVFEQGNHTYVLPVNIKPREWYRPEVKLEGFWPGPVQVTYVHDHSIAVRARDDTPRVLGDSIELGSITIPEPEPEPESEKLKALRDARRER